MGLWIAAAFAAYFIKGLCGFANTLVFTSALSFAYENAVITPAELLLSYPSNIIMTFRFRKSVDWRRCLPVAVLSLLGSLVGVFLLKNAGVEPVKRGFGVLIAVLGAYMLMRLYRPAKRPLGRGLMAGVGVLSGLLSGLYGVGALTGVYMSGVTADDASFKANVSCVFAVESTLRVALYALSGLFTLQTLKTGLLLMPVMLAGLLLGIRLSRRIPEKPSKALVDVMLIVSGLALALG